ncbi:hypothetical protein J3A69_002194 [Pseudomonas putida]|uniref:Uncharacterized protein n=1 Tax=Pseudomonas putida TaxID=303 RepID=A0A1L7NDU7_PSEPU|nr:hypothetical protein [Pseudomonas sp. PvP089]MBP2091250.1 hypothetical protein [Pseudomonas sp. PvP088]MBP2222587.1 hypothetical protein [Pseudomonas putida]BAW23613.1 Uncharacterized protein KF715C_ch30400 [Pseudomonas putida]
MPAKQATRCMARASPVFAGQALSHSDRASFVISYNTVAPQEVRDYLWERPFVAMGCKAAPWISASLAAREGFSNAEKPLQIR